MWGSGACGNYVASSLKGSVIKDMNPDSLRVLLEQVWAAVSSEPAATSEVSSTSLQQQRGEPVWQTSVGLVLLQAEPEQQQQRSVTLKKKKGKENAHPGASLRSSQPQTSLRRYRKGNICSYREGATKSLDLEILREDKAADNIVWSSLVLPMFVFFTFCHVKLINLNVFWRGFYVKSC